MAEIVQSVDRALSILEVLANHNKGLGVTEISEKVNLHKSTVSRLLSTLRYKGYVNKDSKSNKYGITLKLFELGNKKVEGMDLISVAKDYIEKLMEIANEVVHLVVREGNEVIYIDKVEADNTVRMSSTIGKRNPMYCTSVGKAILAHLPEKKIREIWSESKIEKLTKNTITVYTDMLQELKKVKEKGYAIDNEENEIGIRCIGAPLFNRNGEVTAAISISGPTIRMRKIEIETISKEIIKYANLISKDLGYIEDKYKK